ncbi:MAG: hypothetical protein GKR97_06075 [Rhizobiaceae bacterium]|nr:hypothetical protein [Rhizobiaceae bacterium]
MAKTDKPKVDKSTDPEDRLLEAGEQTLLEMQDAMSTMMSASTKMMQSFVDMRMSYLKVMRMGLEDPQASFDVASKNMQDIAKAMKKSSE